MHTRNTLLIIALLAAIALPGSADVNFGGLARFTAMGGAGLAVTDSPVTTSSMNPAALGMLPARISFAFPSVNLRAEGASLNDITDWASKIADLSGPDGIELAREFGKRETMLDASVNTGFMGSPLSLTLDGEARVRITPNAAFREFAETGTLPANPEDMEAVVWAEAATALPSVSLGFKVPSLATGKGDLWLGTRIRFVQGNYTRRTVTWSGSEDVDNLLQTSDEPSQEESGIGADLGIIYRTPGPKEVSFGLVATNLIKPKLGDIVQDTMLSVGMAMRPNSKTLVVADIVNLTDAYDEGMKLRTGVEFRPIRKLALRVGYSGDSFTSGIGIFGLDFAFSSEAPLTVARTIRF